jgi:hypothetical protein
MNNIVNVAQISLVIQYSVAAVLVGAARIPLRTAASASAKGRVKS